MILNYLRDKDTWELYGTVYSDGILTVDDVLDEIGWSVKVKRDEDWGPCGQIIDSDGRKTGIYYRNLEVYTEEEDDEPDFIDNAPNYDKFEKLGMTAEETLVWLNID